MKITIGNAPATVKKSPAVKEGSDPFSRDQNLLREVIRTFYRKGSEPFTGRDQDLLREEIRTFYGKRSEPFPGRNITENQRFPITYFLAESQRREVKPHKTQKNTKEILNLES